MILATRRSLFLLLGVCAIATLVIASRYASEFREVSDGAVLEISTLEALHGRQLLGPYSRFGWRHPGPMYFYLEAPWYRASGLHTAGMQAGALAINAVAVGAIALLAFRWFGAAMSTAIVLAIAAYVVRAGDLLVSVWNPHVIVLPMVAFVLMTAAFVLTGRRTLLIAILVVGSFLVQTHLALAPLVAALGITASFARRSECRDAWVSIAIIAAILWAPVVVEQATRTPGNLTRIATFFAGGGPSGQKAGDALAAWSTELATVVGPRLIVAMGFDFEPARGWWSATVTAGELAALIAVFVRARRRREAAAWLAGLCLLASVVALAAVFRISGRIVDHEVFWISALGALNLAVVVGVIAEVATARIRGRDTFWRGAAVAGSSALVAAVILVGALGMRGVLHRTRTLDDHAVDVVTEAIQRSLTELDSRRPLFRIEPDIWPIAAGALLQIDKTRQRFAVDDAWVNMFGDHFRRNGLEDAVVTIAGSVAAPRVIASSRALSQQLIGGACSGRLKARS